MSEPPRPAEEAWTVGVLVVSGGGFQGLALIKGLRACSRVRVVMADCHAENVGRHFVDEFHPVPRVSDRDAFLGALLEICRRDSIRMVLPSSDWELPALAEARPAFAALDVRVGVAAPDLLTLLRHKGGLHEALERDRFPLLPRLLPRASGPFPLLGKPAAGWGGRGQVVVRSAADLASVPPEALERTHVWQPFLEAFEELSVDFSIDFRGIASGFGLRRRVRTAGGFAVVSDCVRDPESEELVSRLAEWLTARGGCGLFNVQLLLSGGLRFVSDVNPRMGTSAVHWCGQGISPMLHLCAGADPRLAATLQTPGEPSPARVVRYLAELPLQRAAEPGAATGAASGIGGIVFDLDDTLIPHKRWILLKLEALHQSAGGVLPARGVFLRDAMSLVEEGHADTLFDRLALRYGWPDELKEGLIGEYRSGAPLRCPVFGDVWPTLETLRRRGLRLAVLTDNPPASQRQKLDAAGLAPCFDAIVYTRDHGAEKPDARGFHEVASRLALAPGTLASVGDNPYRDVEGALQAGYARAYLLRRPGTLFSFDPALFAELAGEAPRQHVIEGLQPLLTHLHGAAHAHHGPGHL